MRKQKVTVMMMVMLMFIGFGIVIPVLPHVVTEDVGAQEIHVQIMLAVYSLASFLVSPLWGAWSERVGRKPIMMTGMVGFSLSFLLFGLTIFFHQQGQNGSSFGLDSETSLILLYVSRVLSGFFSGAAITVAMAYMADITSDDERTKGMGLIGMAIGMGFIFGPGVGGLLSIGELYWLPFFVSSGLAFFTMILAAFYLRESLPLERRLDKSSSKEKQPSVSRWAAFQGSTRYLYVIAFMATFVLAGLEGTLQLFQMEKIGVTPVQMGTMFFLSGIAGALIQGGFIQRYVKKGDETRYMVIGFVFCGVSFILLLFSQTVYDAAVYLCLFGIGNSLIRPCVTSLITQKANVGHGISTGLSSSFDSLGRVLGPLFAGALFVMDISWPFIVGAVISLLTVLIIFQYITVEKRLSKTI